MTAQLEAVRAGVFEDKPGFPTQYGPDRTDYQPGVPFWPHEVYRDLVIIFVLMAILLFLSAAYTPEVGPPANPAIQPFIVPDWYLLFSWGLLKLADVFPAGQIPDGLGGVINIDAAFWGNMLTFPLVLLPLLLLPFIDRGRETRPAKAAFRTAFGVAFFLGFLFFSSLYATNDRIIASWPFLADDALKWMVIVPPVLIFFATYVGIRRLGFRDMYWWNVLTIGGAFVLVLLMGLWAFALGPWALDGVDPLSRLGTSFNPGTLPLTLFMIVIFAFSAILFYATALLKEKKAKEVVLATSVIVFFVIVGLAKVLADWNFAATYSALKALMLYSNFFIALPLFSLVTFYLGTRTPYSTYEYLLNECYQCGKCHTVCPVTKVEDDALGGLNLVYNTFKKQHDGVPLWTCLACDACSAVCPLDIKYSDYILEERSKVGANDRGGAAADGGRRHAE
jgi:ferredoxin